jgi:hypothetical protein
MGLHLECIVYDPDNQFELTLFKVNRKKISIVTDMTNIKLLRTKL